MSAAQRVTSPNFAPAATTRVSAGRNVASVSFPRIAELSGSNPMEAQEQSIRYDESFDQQHRHQPKQDRPHERQGFADFTNYAAVSYLDEVISETQEWGFQKLVLPAEIMRGVGQYEANMRVISGVDHVAGESYNRVF